MGGIRYLLEEAKKKKPNLPKASRDEKDILEMLTIMISSGVLNVTR